MFLIGPGLTESQRAELRIADDLSGLAALERYLAATRRAGRRPRQ